MAYSNGDKIISRKTHACGGNEWIVVRVGADVKLKCAKCNHCIFVSVDQARKMTKTLISIGTDNE